MKVSSKFSNSLGWQSYEEDNWEKMKSSAAFFSGSLSSASYLPLRGEASHQNVFCTESPADSSCPRLSAGTTVIEECEVWRL